MCVVKRGSCVAAATDLLASNDGLFGPQALGFAKFSLLGWSDGGITALIAAAKNPDKIRKMVVWGSNAFVSQQDIQLYDGSPPQLPVRS